MTLRTADPSSKVFFMTLQIVLLEPPGALQYVLGHETDDFAEINGKSNVHIRSLMSHKRWHVSPDPPGVARRGQLDVVNSMRVVVLGRSSPVRLPLHTVSTMVTLQCVPQDLE
jgi:hypothetical protein